MWATFLWSLADYVDYVDIRENVEKVKNSFIIRFCDEMIYIFGIEIG